MSKITFHHASPTNCSSAPVRWILINKKKIVLEKLVMWQKPCWVYRADTAASQLNLWRTFFFYCIAEPRQTNSKNNQKKLVYLSCCEITGITSTVTFGAWHYVFLWLSQTKKASMRSFCPHEMGWLFTIERDGKWKKISNGPWKIVQELLLCLASRWISKEQRCTSKMFDFSKKQTKKTTSQWMELSSTGRKTLGWIILCEFTHEKWLSPSWLELVACLLSLAQHFIQGAVTYFFLRALSCLIVYLEPWNNAALWRSRCFLSGLIGSGSKREAGICLMFDGQQYFRDVDGGGETQLCLKFWELKQKVV